MRPRLHRHPVVGLAALLVAAGLVASAAAQGAGDLTTRRLLELERRLLAEDLAALETARTATVEATALLDDLSDSLAATAGGGSTRLADLEAAVAAAIEARSAAGRRLDVALSGVAERLRRIRLLAAAVGAADEETVPDVLTGRWQLTLSPGEVGGEIRLDQNGTLVTGSYRFDDGSRGSLEGTLVADLLRLRRIDVTSGFDSVFEARVDPAVGRLEGRWQATVLGRGGAGAGEWVAVRLPEGATTSGQEEPVAGPEALPVAGPDPETPVGTEDSPPAGPDGPPSGDGGEER